jgi:hypothetical protein
MFVNYFSPSANPKQRIDRANALCHLYQGEQVGVYTDNLNRCDIVPRDGQYKLILPGGIWSVPFAEHWQALCAAEGVVEGFFSIDEAKQGRYELDDRKARRNG